MLLTIRPDDILKNPLDISYDKNNMLTVRVKGRSMQPFLSDGELLIVSSTDAEDIAVGDIILYSDKGKYVCHRVFRKRGNSFVTKGDAGLKPDAPIVSEELIGKVVAIQKRRGIIRLDNLRGRLMNRFISRFSLITALLYFAVGKIRNAKNSFS